MKNLLNKKGFTLLELLLALAIFALISIATVRHIQQLTNTRTRALADLDTYNGIRAAFSMMRSDFNQAFHVLYDDLGQESKSLVLQSQPTPHTIFDGRKNSIVFTSLSNRVYYADLKECEQTEISYFLQPRLNSKFEALMKRNSGLIDQDLYTGGEVFTLLENVTALEFTYWDERIAKFVDKWNSDDSEYRDRFPMAIRMKVEVVGKNGEKLKLQEDFKIAFPNNDAQLVQF